jgi:hypothetical protein
VVDAEHHHVVVGAEPEHGGLEQRPLDKVQRAPRLLEEAVECRVLLRHRAAGQVSDVGDHDAGSGDDLHGVSLSQGEGGAQRLVAADDLGQGPAQQVQVEGIGRASCRERV